MSDQITTKPEWVLEERPEVDTVDHVFDLDECVIPNDLAEATYRYSLSAQRVMHHIAAHIPQMVRIERVKDKNGKDTDEVTILEKKMLRVPISVIKDLCGITKTETVGDGPWPKKISEIDQVERIATELQQRTIKTYVMVDGKRARYCGGFIAYTLIYENEQYIEFYVNPPLLPMYLAISRYVRMGLTLVADVQSQYTMRVYVLLKQYEGMMKKSGKKSWERRIEIGWLREHLGIEPTEYKNGAHFRKFVIEQAVKEINDLSDIETKPEYMRGKKNSIVAVVFTCQLKAQKKTKLAIEPPKKKQTETWTADDRHRYQELTGEIFKKNRSDGRFANLADDQLMNACEIEAERIIKEETGRTMK